MDQPERKPPDSIDSPVPGNETSELLQPGKFIEIRIKGQLTELWADWFEGMMIEDLEDGEMLLSGTVVDQAALMGILNKLNRLNLSLISLREVK